MRADHPLARRFRALAGADIALEGCHISARASDDFGLMLCLEQAPTLVFNPAMLAREVGGPVFSAHGERVWARIRELGQMAMGVCGPNGADLAVGTVLGTTCLETAQDVYAAELARAAPKAA